MRMYAYEEAAQYQRALHACRFADPDESVRCELLLRLGEAQARAGDYPDAKETYLQAAQRSRRLGSPEQLARAALGFGEPQAERGRVDRQLVGLLQEALDSLSPRDSSLRVRLLARLSTELTFATELTASDEAQRTEPLSRQAVEMARRVGDVAALGSALHARWLALMAPGEQEERSALAGEVLQLARTTGDRDSEAARSLYPVLLPFAGHVVAITIPHPLVCFGSASFYLGLLATVTARWAEAGDHFEAALGTNDQLGARPLLARTRYEYAHMLLRRGQAADRARALGLLEQASGVASSLGMAALVEGIQTLQAVEAGGSAPAEPAAGAVGPAPVARNVFRREGEYWTVGYEGSVVRLKDAKGLRHLARLLAQPAREFHVTDLEAAGSGGESPEHGERAHHRELASRADLGDAGELLDAAAKAAYKARVEELRAEVEEAEGFNDPVRAARARAELDFLTRELARAVGLGGRDRRAASHAERARLNVTRAILAALANLARANPALARHLAATIRTGRYCSYTRIPASRSPGRPDARFSHVFEQVCIGGERPSAC